MRNIRSLVLGLVLVSLAGVSWGETYVCDEQLHGGFNREEANLVQYVRDSSGFRRSVWKTVEPIVYEDEFIIHLLSVAAPDGKFGTDVQTTIYKLNPNNDHLGSQNNESIKSAFVRRSYLTPSGGTTWTGKCSIVD